jgi:hypothetical protein
LSGYRVEEVWDTGAMAGDGDIAIILPGGATRSDNKGDYYSEGEGGGLLLLRVVCSGRFRKYISTVLVRRRCWCI